MLWGYGLGGLDPFRTRRVLDQPNAKSELLEVSHEAYDRGGLSAFELVADRRSKGSTSFLQVARSSLRDEVHLLSHREERSQESLSGNGLSGIQLVP